MDLNDPVVAMWREYRLARMFGWTLEEIDAAPAEWIDWALQFGDQDGPR